MKQTLIVIFGLIICFASAGAQRYKYVADSPVADVIFCSETPDEHGMINRKNSGEWTIKCGDTVTVVGRKVVKFYLDSVNATNIYAVLDDNGHKLYTEARFLTPVDPDRDFFVSDKFNFSPGFLYDFFGDSWDLRSGKGRALYSIFWPILVLALMTLATFLVFISFLHGFKDSITFFAALSAFASVALLFFLTYHLRADVAWWCNSQYCSTWQSLGFALLLGLFMIFTWFNFVFLYVASQAPIWTSFFAVILFCPIMMGVSLLLFHYEPDADLTTHTHQTYILGAAICIGLPCLYGLIRRGWLGMLMPPVYMAMLYAIYWMFFIFSFTILVALGIVGAAILIVIIKNPQLMTVIDINGRIKYVWKDA